MKFKAVFLLSLLAAASVQGVTPSKPEFTLPKVNTPPQIDGRILAGEWKNAVKLYGVVRHNSPYLSSRQAEQYFALDNQYVYFASRSELPPKGMELFSRAGKRDGAVYLDDNVEFLLCPPNEKYVYQLMVNSKGITYDKKYPVINGGTTPTDAQKWDPSVQTVSRIENGFWTLEMRIPLADFGILKAPARGEIFRILAGRNWTRPLQQTTLKKVLYFTSPEEMARFVYAPDKPHIAFHGIGDNTGKGAHNIVFEIINSSSNPVTVQYRLTVSSDSAPRHADSSVTVPAGKSIPVKLEFFENNQVVRTLAAAFRDAADGQILHERTFTWNPGEKVTWKDPKEKQSAELEFGVYPYYKKVKVRFGNPAQPAENWKSAVFSLEKNGKNTCRTSGVKTPYGYEAEIAFEPVAGEYKLHADLEDKFGKKTIQARSFKIENFPWENNSIGTERVIIPPFKKLSYAGSREVKATLTGYTFRDGFFDRISAADAPNILAAPITLKINDESVKEKSFRFTEKSPDRAITESVLNWQGGNILVKGEFDYDGFCKFTLTFQPKGTQKIEKAEILVPLKKEIAELIHSTCDRMRYNDAGFIPPGQGIVWKSSQTHLTTKIRGNFRPYVWFGGMEKGLAWISESDKHWSLDPQKDALTLERTSDSVVLHVNLVNKPTVWKTPFTVQQAFQATPVKPQPEYRRRLMERIAFANAWNLCTLAGSSCWGTGRNYLFFPEKYDYSYVNLLQKRQFAPEKDTQFIESYIERNMPQYRAEDKTFMRNHLKRGIVYAKMAKYMVPYTNARVSWLNWPDYRTYMDEWWCSEYRAENADEYNNTPTRSYQDMVLFNLRRLVREGMEGVYFDNIRDWANPNPVTGPAYHREDGTVQPYFDIFTLRELVKRTAVMLVQEKKTFPDGRPVLTCHMTNTNLIPVLAFATISLDLEAHYGSKDFQDRFSEGYLRTCTTGLQSGVVPEILIQISGNRRDAVTRSFLAVTLAYDLPFVMNAGGLTHDWSRIWRKLYEAGYSTPAMEVFPCWKNGPVTTPCKNWRIASYRKKATGEIMAAVCSFGETAESTVRVSEDVPMRCFDWETGKELPMKKNTVKIKISQNDFRMLRFIQQ